MDWSCCCSQSGRRRYGSFVFISPGAELISVLLSLSLRRDRCLFFPSIISQLNWNYKKKKEKKKRQHMHNNRKRKKKSGRWLYGARTSKKMFPTMNE